METGGVRNNKPPFSRVLYLKYGRNVEKQDNVDNKRPDATTAADIRLLKEFVAVRVQDPRIQNEGSWNSHVDYKIFLHTNSKAFTAKTSCVRRRYNEFVWLKKKLQKNSGLVPVPDLPGKSFFSFSNDDFLERRRKGLQTFLDKVLHMTVCLSDSQLHLFLQTQLPVGHIEDCVQGHTPYSVTDAILTYASSNRGLAQAQEEGSIKDPSLTVSYESMESPAPHQPCPLTEDTFSPELFSCGDSDPLGGLLELCDKHTAKLPDKEKSLIRVLQKNNHLEAVVEDCGLTEAKFYLGDSQDYPENLSLAEQTHQRSCQIQTPVEVHLPMGTGFEENCGQSLLTLDRDVLQAVPHPDTEADQLEISGEENVERVNSEPEKCLSSIAILEFKDREAGPQEEVLEDICSEKQVLENHVIAEVDALEHVESTKVDAKDVSCPEEFKNSDIRQEPYHEKSEESESKEPLESETHGEMHSVRGVPEVESGGNDTVQPVNQKPVEQEVDLVGTKDLSDGDSHSLPSSNESIVKVSDEESICGEAEDSIQAANGYMKTSPEKVTHWSEVVVSSRNILGLHMNGCPVAREDISTQEDEDLRYMTDIGDVSKSLDLNSTVTAGDLTENSDFNILETSCTSGLADNKCTEQETLSSLSLDTIEETHEVEVN